MDRMKAIHKMNCSIYWMGLKWNHWTGHCNVYIRWKITLFRFLFTNMYAECMRIQNVMSFMWNDMSFLSIFPFYSADPVSAYVALHLSAEISIIKTHYSTHFCSFIKWVAVMCHFCTSTNCAFSRCRIIAKCSATTLTRTLCKCDDVVKSVRKKCLDKIWFFFFYGNSRVIVQICSHK